MEQVVCMGLMTASSLQSTHGSFGTLILMENTGVYIGKFGAANFRHRHGDSQGGRSLEG